MGSQKQPHQIVAALAPSLLRSLGSHPKWANYLNLSATGKTDD
jgi:hypothetical protein